MKYLHDLVRGWIEKADSDLKTVRLLIGNGRLKSASSYPGTPASRNLFLKVPQ